MNVLIAMDSFKGSVSSRQAGEAVQKGLKSYPSVISKVISVSDGGEGSLDVIYDMKEGFWQYCKVQNAFHEEKEVPYLLRSVNGKTTVFIESAQMIGLHNHSVDEKTVEKVSSYGLGQLLYHVIEQEVDEIVVFLGGTITTDGGLGILQALGVTLFDEQGNKIPVDCNPLLHYTELDAVTFKKVQNVLKKKKLIIASDVCNVFSGENGAAHIFAAQKGATHEQIAKLDEKLQLFARFPDNIDLNHVAGSGAAGGIAGTLLLLGGRLQNGFDVLNEILDFTRYVKEADLIFTGEGSIDAQSNQGKLPQRMAELAKQYDKPIIALCGKRDKDLQTLEQLFNGVFSIQTGPTSMEHAIASTSENLTLLSQNIFHLLQGIKHLHK